MAITLENMPSGAVARATIGSLIILARAVTLALFRLNLQQVRGVCFNPTLFKVKDRYCKLKLDYLVTSLAKYDMYSKFLMLGRKSYCLEDNFDQMSLCVFFSFGKLRMNDIHHSGEFSFCIKWLMVL